MILSGKEIIKQVKEGNIHISNFSEENVNPNSYNVTLANKLLVYEDDLLDMKKDNKFREITIPEEGLILEPGKLYLGRTVEKTETDAFVPMLEGRSSIGRLGLEIHVTAGFGDIGFAGFWTLELAVVQPLKIYPNVEIGQVYYHTILGDYDLYNSNKYQHNEGIQTSQLYKELQ